MIGSLALDSTSTKSAASTTVLTSSQMPVADVPALVWTGPAEIEHEAGHRADDGRRAEIVDRGLAAYVMQLECQVR